MKLDRSEMRRCLFAVLFGAAIFVGWILACAALIVQGIVPISMQTVLAGSGTFLASMVIGTIGCGRTKNMWLPLCGQGGCLLLLLVIGLLHGGIEVSRYGETALLALGGFLFALLLKKRGEGRRKTGRRYTGRTQKGIKNATR